MLKKLLSPFSRLLEAQDILFSPRIIGAVPLEIFFHKKTGYKEVIMTGVFDRISKQGPVFDYVEEDL